MDTAQKDGQTWIKEKVAGIREHQYLCNRNTKYNGYEGNCFYDTSFSSSM